MQGLGQVTTTIKNSENSVNAAFVAPTVNANGKIVETSADLTDAGISDYFVNNVKPLFVGNPLKEIANQKYLAFFGVSGESKFTMTSVVGKQMVRI